MKYKLFFFLISMLFIVLGSKAQTEQYCLHYPYNTQVGMNLNVNLLSKIKIHHPTQYLCSRPSFGADLGVYMYQRIYKWFGIQIGAEYSAITYRFSATNDFHDMYFPRMRYYSMGAFTFPVLFNASYYFNEKHGMDISFGGATLIFFTPYYSSGHSAEMPVGYGGIMDSYDWTTVQDSPYNFSFYGKIGYNFLFKNKNTLGVAIIGSYASKPYSKGYYFIEKTEDWYSKVDGGYTSFRNTYIGLQFSYGFTMKKTMCKPDIVEDETE